MTKLQFLNAYFTERLMAAVQEIMLVVGDTLKEYQDEADQTKIENEILRRRLREVGIDAEAALKKCSEPVAPPLSVNRAVTEQQELSCTLRQDIQPTVTAVKVEFTEQHSVRQGEEELTGPQPTSPGPAFPSPCAKRECEQDSLNKSMPPYRKSDCSLDFLAHPDLKMQIVNTEEMEPLPTVLCRVKKETDGLDYSSSNTPTKSLSLSVYNPSNEDCDNSGSVNEEEGSRPITLSEAQNSSEKMSVLQGGSSLSCVYCGKVFFLVSRLKAHLRIHTEDSSFRCTICGKCFSQSGNLNVHQRVHTGKKPYSCNICGKGFKYSGKFKEHLRIHTGERPYHCTFCGKYFSQSGHLKAHVRIHTGEKPYRCPVCGNCFSQLSQIKRHLLTHTPEISFGNHGLGEELN